MKDFRKLQEMDHRARELAGLYAAEKKRADSLEAKLRALKVCEHYEHTDGHALSPLVRDLLEVANYIGMAAKALEADRDDWRRQALAENARANEAQSVANCNQLKIRKSMERLREWAIMDLNENAFIADSSGNYMKFIKGTIEIANAALSAPPRNCDIGTAEEQSKRFKKYCALNKDFEWGCEKYPIFPYKIIKCEFIWAQLPYESEAK